MLKHTKKTADVHWTIASSGFLVWPRLESPRLLVRSSKLADVPVRTLRCEVQCCSNTREATSVDDCSLSLSFPQSRTHRSHRTDVFPSIGKLIFILFAVILL